MSIRSDAYRDAGTGLLRRAAFRHELASYLDNQPVRDKPGCLLLIRFPILQKLASRYTSDTVDKAFCDLLALLETRFRGRDNMGRLSVHSLCVHLRQCAPSHAHGIARDYLKLLDNLDLKVEGKRYVVMPQVRVVPIKAAESERATGATVIPHRLKSKHEELPSTAAGKILDPIKTAQNFSKNYADVIAFDSRREYWRIEPSRWLCSANDTVHMVRLRSLNKHVRVDNAKYMLRILDSLALNPDHRSRTVPRRIVVPAELNSLSADTVRWLVDQTRERRVAPADICFQFAAVEASEQLRSALPLLRRLRRAGFRLMLSDADDVRALGILQRALKVDYVLVSARRMLVSARTAAVSGELAKLVASVHVEGGRVVGTGIDTDYLFEHARTLKIDLGFGRSCGRSLRFGSLKHESSAPHGQ